MADLLLARLCFDKTRLVWRIASAIRVSLRMLSDIGKSQGIGIGIMREEGNLTGTVRKVDECSVFLQVLYLA